VPTNRQLRPFGAELRRQRLAAGMSLSDLAHRVHYSKGYLSKIETGRKAANRDLARRCDTALGTNGTLTSLVPAVRAGVSALTDGAVDDHWIIGMESSGRGGFGADAHLEPARVGHTGRLTWAMPPASDAHSLGAREINSFRLVFDEMRRLGQVMAPAALLPILITHTHALKLLAKVATAPARARVLLLASRFAEYTSWMAQEAGDDYGALWWTDRAVELASAGGDRELAAYALVRRGLIAMYRSDARETISVTRRAQAAPCGPRIRGLAALHEAQGHALAGDYDHCCRALDRATTLIQEAAATDDGQPLLGTTTTPDPVAMVTGWCMLDLGHPRRALDLLQGELAAVPDHAHRTLARIGVRYSLALVDSGELEHACTMVDRLLDAVVLTDSATVRIDLRRLAKELNRRYTHRAVKAISPRLTGALQTTY
jgi:transcriptional regulator with XRE-family HTH domain